jgi:hypothetical protein
MGGTAKPARNPVRIFTEGTVNISAASLTALKLMDWSTFVPVDLCQLTHK